MNQTRKLRTLLVDDESLSRRGLELRLRVANDIEIIGQCTNGREALEAIREFKPDLVFLDIQMPGLSGFDVLAQLNRCEPPPVVAMMTFEPSSALRSRAGDSGANLFFDKASEAGALLDLLNNLGSGKVTLASLSKPKTNQ